MQCAITRLSKRKPFRSALWDKQSTKSYSPTVVWVETWIVRHIFLVVHVNSIIVLEADNNECVNDGQQIENIKNKKATFSKSLLSILADHMSHMTITIGKGLRRRYQKALSSLNSGYLLVLVPFIVSFLVMTGLIIFYHQNANGKLKFCIECEKMHL